VEKICRAIEQALAPYGSFRDNLWSRNDGCPSIALPGDLIYRCTLIAASRKEGDGKSEDLSVAPLSARGGVDTTEFASRAKQRAKKLLNQSVLRMTTEAVACTPAKEVDHRRRLPDFVAREELGYLGLHVQLVPSSGLPRPSHVIGGSSSGARRKRRGPWIAHQQNRGGESQHQPQQGGDPRTNLERRLEAQGIATWTINQALSLLEAKTFRFTHVDTAFLHDLSPVSSSSTGTELDVHVAVWRRPFYIRGEYTKNRRDVSQSPFYVPEGGRVGVTSVEEQIIPAVIKHCGGISDRNRDYRRDAQNPSSPPPRTAVSYGAAKFHASGREDTDVRMLLPPPPPSSSREAAATAKATGRPFVCEVIDSLRIPTDSDLAAMRDEINHVPDCSASMTTDTLPTTAAATSFYYGCNPLGVGVSSLRLVPALAFKRLQSETESKMKRYSCLCWSEDPIPSSAEALEARLMGTSNGERLPLQIAQRTPVRVLHRRAPMVRTRRILSCRVAEVIDGHRFRLRLSTDAGTYIKEFVHGDMGRTVPSVSSMLGCKTDILELDCEGVEMGDSDDDDNA
jgi:tRNA U54 and U55 pseudouridine synthase Pus10